MNISEVIDNLQYVKDCLADERGSDFSGVEALTIAIEIIKMEPVKSEMYFKRKEIEKMISLNAAITALNRFTDDIKYHEEHDEVIVDKAVWKDAEKALEQKICIKLDQIREYLIDNVFRNPDVMFSKERYEKDLPDIIASLYEVLHRTVTGKPYEYMFHWANKIGAWVEDDLFTHGGDKE